MRRHERVYVEIHRGVPETGRRDGGGHVVRRRRVQQRAQLQDRRFRNGHRARQRADVGVRRAPGCCEIAQGERRTAETQLEGLVHDRDIADKEKQQAQLEVEKANSEFEASVQAHDQNRNAAASHGKDVADLGLKMADAKLDWIVQKKAWYKANRSAADAHVAAAEAKVELEKARVAKTKGIKTADEVDVGKFESQWKDRSSDWQSAKEDAESEQKSTQKLEEKWKDLVGQHSKSQGG